MSGSGRFQDAGIVCILVRGKQYRYGKDIIMYIFI
nr:MAG TPA: hypothetical protein [Caudoviricetes sp.]